MRNFFRHVLRLLCLSIAVLLVSTSVAIAPTVAQPSYPQADFPPLPASIDASTGTNVTDLQSTPPGRSGEEFEKPPHVYDIQSIREFDLDLYRTRDDRPSQPSDRS